MQSTQLQVAGRTTPGLVGGLMEAPKQGIGGPRSFPFEHTRHLSTSHRPSPPRDRFAVQHRHVLNSGRPRGHLDKMRMRRPATQELCLLPVGTRHGSISISLLYDGTRDELLHPQRGGVSVLLIAGCGGMSGRAGEHGRRAAVQGGLLLLTAGRTAWCLRVAGSEGHSADGGPLPRSLHLLPGLHRTLTEHRVPIGVSSGNRTGRGRARQVLSGALLPELDWYCPRLLLPFCHRRDG
mmetsp:Transcript_30041/g.74621  ORF Transcript_30041/g.74621 Transcript_30041/m.74621 type:complete len:237 (+) Transcript_30041:596-1306(+)